MKRWSRRVKRIRPLSRSSPGLNLLGRAATETGEYAKAIGLFEEALAIHRQRDEQPGIAGMLMELGWAAMRGGENDRAESNLTKLCY